LNRGLRYLRLASQSSRRIGGVAVPHKANFLPNAMVNAKVNAHVMRDASQGSPDQVALARTLGGRWVSVSGHQTRCAVGAATRSRRSGDGAHPRSAPELAVSQNAVQIQAFPGRACPVELITELLQRHRLLRLIHGTTVTMFSRDDSPAISAVVLRESRTGPPVLVLSVFTPW
jgi:hypothetical protein